MKSNVSAKYICLCVDLSAGILLLFDLNPNVLFISNRLIPMLINSKYLLAIYIDLKRI